MVEREAAAPGGEGTVHVEVADAGDQSVVIVLFDSEQSFKDTDIRKPRESWSKTARTQTVSAVDGVAKASFGELPEGGYGAFVLVDLNGNGVMDTSLLGMPEEPWGLSNDVRPQLMPPKPPQWNEISVGLEDGAVQTLQITARSGV